MRRRVVRKGGTFLICTRDNQLIGKSKTDRAWRIFEALKAPRGGTPGSKSGRRHVKYFHFNSRSEVHNSDIGGREDSKTVEETKDLAVQQKERRKMKLLSFEERRIRYGKSLMRKRKNGGKWAYNPGREPDFNLEQFYEEYDEDEDVGGDEVEDENGDEDDDKDENYSLMFRPRYCSFDKSGRRAYFIRLKGSGPFDSNYHIKLLQKAFNCTESEAEDRQPVGCDGSALFCGPMTEEEADAIAGLDEVRCVRPARGPLMWA